ncbi:MULTISPECIES: N-acetylglucosamine/diacetylchitobiose ABC transporter substrate-binding protein [Leucobacter]|uniref:N-acetylglucosamine transport system substrate-binding protein n=1 Tax=Leucobacter aridicollis TaxID=283878 RepID=A0A852RBQ0_9MICO|nr:N-acetylglucosamine/diacetylchitobiose ABC transporter substrate-binding protein [Leucobacter aridicollis]NYD27849.1 N-acetylglucosamine transport system substrate-binding protein [Leucobacter aridicollis]
MYTPRFTMSRRVLTAAAGATVLALSLGACAATPGGPAERPSQGSDTTGDAKNPFGVAAGSTVDAVIFDNANNVAFFDTVTPTMQELHEVDLKVTPSTQIAQQVQPRFVAGTPPDLLHSAGSGSIPVASMLPDIEDLTSVTNAMNLDGEPIADTLYPGVLDLAKYDGKLAAVNYSLNVHAMWYSKSMFDKYGWEAPKTWDEAMELGAAAKKEGKYLFTWGKEGSAYYLSLAIDSAVKEGGRDVLASLANLEADSWSQPEVQQSFTALKEIVDAGYFIPGGAGTQFKAAQAQWSLKQEALMYPTGSWIEGEMGDEIADGFEMVGAPAPTITTQSALPYEAMRFAGGNRFVVPSDAANAAGAKETLRVMLSPDAAAEFSRINKSLTIVKDTVPADGFGSTSLVSARDLLDNAGENAFAWDFTDAYPFGDDKTRIWNDFLSGSIDVDTLTSEMQKLSDKIREDDSIVKIKVGK